MKRYLAGAALAGCLLALGAGTSTAAGFDPSSQTGYISRGDVISAGGKGALIANPVISYTFTVRARLTCTWQDSTQLSAPMTTTVLRLYHAETRVSGNGTITGYFISPGDLFESQITPPGFDAQEMCWAIRGVTDDGSTVDTDVTQLSTASALTFFGPTGSFNLGF